MKLILEREKGDPRKITIGYGGMIYTKDHIFSIYFSSVKNIDDKLWKLFYSIKANESNFTKLSKKKGAEPELVSGSHVWIILEGSKESAMKDIRKYIEKCTEGFIIEIQ